MMFRNAVSLCLCLIMACLTLFRAWDSLADAGSSGKLGQYDLVQKIQSDSSYGGKNYLYYELDLGNSDFNCPGTLQLQLPPPPDMKGNYKLINAFSPLIVIRAGRAVIGENCRIGQEKKQQGFEVLVIVSGSGSVIAPNAHPVDGGGHGNNGRSFGLQEGGKYPVDTVFVPPFKQHDGKKGFSDTWNDRLAYILINGSDGSACSVSDISMTGDSGTCSRSVEFTVRGSGQCSWRVKTDWGSGFADYSSGTHDFDADSVLSLRVSNAGGSLRAVRVSAGNSSSRDFNVSGSAAGLRLVLTRTDSQGGAKIAGKQASYSIGVRDGDADCSGVSLTGVKAGLLRSSDNEKSGIRASVNGTAIGFIASPSDPLPTDIILSGNSIDFDYSDYGRTTLYVSGTPVLPGSDGGDAGDADSSASVLTGSAEISSFPQGICVRYSDSNSTKLCSGGCELLRAGEEFLLDVLPVAYSKNVNDPLACSDAAVRSRVLQSFRMKDIPLLRSISRENAGNAPEPAEDRDLPAEVETMQGSGDEAVSGKFDYGSDGSLLPDGMSLRARIGTAGIFRAHIPSIEWAEGLSSVESFSSELNRIYPYAYRIWWADDPSAASSFAKSMSFCRKADSGSYKYPWFTYAGQPFRLRYARIEAVSKQGTVIRNYDSSIAPHAADVPRMKAFARDGAVFSESKEVIERLPEDGTAAPVSAGWTEGRLYTADSSSGTELTRDWYFRLRKDGLKDPLTLYMGVGVESSAGAAREVICGADGQGERFSAAAADGGSGTAPETAADSELCAFGGKSIYASMDFLTGRLRAVSGRTGKGGEASVPFVAEYVSSLDGSGNPVWTQNYPDSCTALSFGSAAEPPFSWTERIVSGDSVKDTAAVSPVRKSGTEHDASDAYTVTPQGGLPFSLNFSRTYRGKIENSESAAPESSVFARMRNGTAVLRLVLNGNYEDTGARRADFRYVLKRSTIGHLKDTETDPFDLKSAESPVWLGDTVIGSVIFGGRVVSPRMIYLQDGN